MARPSNAGRRFMNGVWVSPVAFGAPSPGRDWRWNQHRGDWEKNTDKLQQIMLPATVGLLTAGAGSAAGLWGGATGAGGGTSAAGSTPGLGTGGLLGGVALPMDAAPTTLATLGGLSRALPAAANTARRGLSTSDLLLGGADWGLNFFNNWLQSRAQNRVTEAELTERAADREQREREFARSLGLSESRLALEREEAARRYGLSAAEFEAQQRQFADRYGLERAMWEQQEASRVPYRSAGTGALSALSRGMGTSMPPVERVAAPPPSGRVSLAALSGSAAGQPAGSGTFGRELRYDENTGMAVDAQGQPTNTGIVSPITSGPATIRLRAPTGAEREVPADQAAYYLQRGAVRA